MNASIIAGIGGSWVGRLVLPLMRVSVLSFAMARTCGRRLLQATPTGMNKTDECSPCCEGWEGV